MGRRSARPRILAAWMCGGLAFHPGSTGSTLTGPDMQEIKRRGASVPDRDPRGAPGTGRDWRLPVLMAAVLVLLLNDLVLKAALASWWTGKLSDVAGLFAFALFWSLLFPRWRWWIAGVTAVGFVFWKSPASQPLVDGLDLLTPFAVARVVDWTDCLALAVLPAAVVLAARGPRWSLRRVRDLGVAGLSLFAFAATETLPTDMPWQIFEYEESYLLDAPRERVVFELADMGARVQIDAREVRVEKDLWWRDCPLETFSQLEEGDSVSSMLRLIQITHGCDLQEGDHADALRVVYEDSSVTPLRHRLAP